MQGQDQPSSSPLGCGDPESRVPAKHPLRPGCEMLGVSPHVAQHTCDTGRTKQESAFDGPTTRLRGYAFGRRRGTTL